MATMTAQTRSLVAMEVLDRLYGRLHSRPYKPDGDANRLLLPQCERQCDDCYMDCAILPERINWREGELARLGGNGRVLHQLSNQFDGGCHATGG